MSRAARETAKRRHAWVSRWRLGTRARNRWTDAQRAEEEARLAAEVEARVAAGEVTICPPPNIIRPEAGHAV